MAALAFAGCAGSVTADEQSLLAEASLGSSDPTAEAKTAPDAPTPAEDSLVTSTPDANSPVGSLAPEFPTELLPMPDDAVLLVTSAVPVGDAGVKEVSLNLRTTWTTSRILDLYRTHLLGEGFTEVPAVDTALAAESTFTRSDGDEIVSVGVLDADGVRTVTVGGRVRASD
ncbi:hypothetical protein [Actinotalea sp.]|uniref:hypothetical protein n=1 Tax=Actinotalea sp. TaxID=1872145 RepID=UPI003562A53C